jgi:hypothetical protein
MKSKLKAPNKVRVGVFSVSFKTVLSIGVDRRQLPFYFLHKLKERVSQLSYKEGMSDADSR